MTSYILDTLDPQSALEKMLAAADAQIAEAKTDLERAHAAIPYRERMLELHTAKRADILTALAAITPEPEPEGS